MISHDTKTRLTKILIRNKEAKKITGKKLTAEGLLPITMVSEFGNFILQFNIDKKTKEFTLNVANPNKSNNAVLDTRVLDYDKLPLKALSDGKFLANNTLISLFLLTYLEEEKDVLMIEGKILFDQIPIIKENKKTVWSPDLMQLWIDTKKIGEYT